MNQNISIIGLGKLGSCMAAAYASKGHNVIGVDINDKFVSALDGGRAPVQETDLQKYIDENKSRISATQDYGKAINNSDITFIIVPTPTDHTGGFSVDYVLKSCEDIGRALKGKNTYHLVVLTSTVLPGDCDEKIIPALEKFSGKACGKDFGFCYNPEFIAIGTVIRDLLNPDFFLIGEFDQRSGDLLEKFYSVSSNNNARILRMNIPTAELTKISINHYLTTKITFANMLAEVAHSISGVHVDKVTEALGSDTRIGHKYLRGGLGFGGPCFPRDNRAFATMAQRRGIGVPYAQITDDYNKGIADRMINIVLTYAEPQSRIGVLGLSYKPGTGFCEESQGLNIAKKLAQNYQVGVHEPSGHYHAETLLNDAVKYHEDLDSLLKNSDIIFLTNWDKNNDLLKGKKFEVKKIIIDPWRQFTADDFSGEAVYVPLGIGR